MQKRRLAKRQGMPNCEPRARPGLLPSGGAEVAAPRAGCSQSRVLQPSVPDKKNMRFLSLHPRGRARSQVSENDCHQLNSTTFRSRSHPEPAKGRKMAKMSPPLGGDVPSGGEVSR